MKYPKPKTNKIGKFRIKYEEKNKIFQQISQTITNTDKIMITVSGGPDSMFTAYLMYDFFIQQNFSLQNIHVIHCNHNTRAGNKKDEKLIKETFIGTTYFIAKKNDKSKKTEADLRKRRYGIFKTYAKKHGITKIIFGHNLTDRIESTFLNLLRGANINGFLAMQTQENHHLLPGIQVVRPILSLTKNEVLELCKKNKIPFIIDPTNTDITTSLRNKLRSKVLPELYKLAHKQTTTNNSFIESMKNIYTTLETSHNILNSNSGTKCCSRNGILHPIKKSVHRKAKFAYQRTSKNISNEELLAVMKHLHITNNITTALLNELKKFLNKNESGYKYVNNTYFFKSHGNIYIISAPKSFREKTIDSEKKIDTVTMKRFPRKGDRYKGKTWNQWCINQKIPIFRRNFIPIIVTKNNQVIKIFRPQI